MAKWLFQIGKWSAKRRKGVIAGGLLILVLAASIGLGMGTAFTSEMTIPGTKSDMAGKILEQEFPSSGGGGQIRLIFKSGEGTLDSDPAKKEVTAALQKIQQDSSVQSIASPYESGTLNAGHTIGYADVTYKQAAGEVAETSKEHVLKVVESLRKDGIQTELGGSVAFSEIEVGGVSEVIGILIAFLILAFTFTSFLAAGLPILTAVIGLGIGLMIVVIGSNFVNMSSFSITLAVMLALAVGIDYALFIISRYRQQLAAGYERNEAIAQANATAGSSVVFAGLTVIIALAGLSVVQIPFITMMGLAAAISVFVAVLIAVIFVPAVLAAAGERIGPARENKWLRKISGGKKQSGSANRWGRLVTGKPWLTAILSIAILSVCTLPFLHMELGLPDNGLKSDKTTERRGYVLLAEGFGEGFNGPLIVVARAGQSKDPQKEIASATAYLKDLNDVASVSPVIPSSSGKAAIISVLPKTGPHDIKTTELVKDIRDKAEKVLKEKNIEIMVTGGTAVNIDISEKLSEALPKFALLIVGLAFVLLMLVFRSILVPVKAVLGFLLTLGSTLGFVVWVIQDGHLANLFGIPVPGPVLSFLPILVTGILFGLAMDYEVFLVSRMREDYSRSGDARGAVISGMKHSGPVVTAAGLIMIAVFASFIFAGDPIIKSMGLALSFGILFDAFIVRLTLVPAVMTLLERHAWYLPKWLDRLLPNIDVEGESVMKPAGEAHAAQSGGSREMKAAVPERAGGIK
ncbi:MMPL family transporter [Paenibacillus sp. HN-1]|uniref:MMPL family transporter n=1 Tax=Paenibacillus TaxID=44249 RepID=UPI001CA92339|nr:MULTISPECIES: MMPL family transporter [Paenibacillus]MBY9079089.1 MMPL family transporter [Paenibacillus sp. CGMCC 1.18879]MBY9086867.1 MMPL family transporter [Paenibacillus sinensis]